MKNLIVDVGGAQSRAELCSKLLEAMEAPEWHGKNLDALDETVSYGGNETIEPPYSVTLTNVGQLSQELRSDVNIIRDIFIDAKNHEGRDVSCKVIF